MNDSIRNEALLDAILDVAIEEAYQKEMNELPSIEELNRIYKPSPVLDKRIKKLINQKNIKLKMKHFTKNFVKVAAYVCIMFTLSLSILISVSAN